MPYPFDQTLPLVATGVDPQANPNALQFQQQPQFVAPAPSLPEILTSIAGLGLNIAGAATRSGAHGNGTINAAQEMGARNLQQAQLGFQEQQRQAKLQADQTQGQAIWDRALKTTKNKETLNQIKAYAEGNEPDKAASYLQQEINNQRMFANLDRKEQDRLGQIALGVIGDQTKNVITQERDYTKNPQIQELEGQVNRMNALQQFYSGHKEIITSQPNFIAQYNQTLAKSGLPKLSQKEGAAVFKDYQDYIRSKQQPDGLIDEGLSKIGLKPLKGKLGPKDLFANYAPEKLGDNLTVYNEVKGKRESFASAKSRLNELHQIARKDKKFAYEVVSQNLHLDPPPAKVSWQDWAALSPENREVLRSKLNGK